MTVRLFAILLLLVASTPTLPAATLRVPEDHSTIQKAIDASKPGDTIIVAAGKYVECLRLKDGLTIRSAGDDTAGTEGLKRAEATIIDGGGKAAKAPGVRMAEGCTLDGFTITNVGAYDEALWKKHFDSLGEELGDEEGAVQAEGSLPAISIIGVTCTVRNCIVHHNGDVGIGLVGQPSRMTQPQILHNRVFRNMGGGIGVADGAEGVIANNVCYENLRAGIGCRNANPVITQNRCFQNIRAGIGCREGARPVIRNNRCYQNRRAGIGIRMKETAPVVEGNECADNAMAGIGCRDEASPILRKNRCHNNKLAGIGVRDGADALIVGNVCRANGMAGIGIQQAKALIQRNECVENKQVAIGVIRESVAAIIDNELSRTGGQPPIIAVRDGSMATIHGNRIAGGGAAGLLIQGNVTVIGNTFRGLANNQGNAIWVWEGSKATLAENTITGYRSGVIASKAAVTIQGNSIHGFSGIAIRVTASTMPAHVQGNTGTSPDPKAKIVEIQGKVGSVDGNQLTNEPMQKKETP